MRDVNGEGRQARLPATWCGCSLPPAAAGWHVDHKAQVSQTTGHATCASKIPCWAKCVSLIAG